MEHEEVAQRIGRGAQAYLRAFALADCMELHREGGVEWICPKKGFDGPALVYGLALDEESLERRVGAIIGAIREKRMPALWFASPGWMPRNAADILISNGFSDISEPGEPEPAMALDLETAPAWPEPNPDVQVKRVRSPAEFSAWCDIVNGVLHGRPMVTPEHYSPWLGRDTVTMYLACLHGMPAAAAATVPDGDSASLEFVATLKEYRRMGAATAVCAKALEDLRGRHIRLATLRAFPDGAALYEKLGFRTYYATVMLSYPVDREARTDGQDPRKG